MSKCSPTDGLKRRILFESKSFKVLDVIESESANLGNSITDLERGNRHLIVLDYPCGIQTVCCIILHHAGTVNLKKTVAKKNVLDIGSGITGINNRSIVRGYKRTLLIKVAGVSKNVYLAADSITVFIVEINLGVNVYLARYKLSSCKVSVSGLSLIVVEAVKSHLTFTYAVIAKVVVQAVNSLHSGELDAVRVVRVTLPAVSNNNSVDVRLAVGIYTVKQLTALALKHAVSNSILVSGRGNGSAPIYNRVADCAEGSTDVAGLSASGGKICYSCCGMYVTAIPSIIICKSIRSCRHRCVVAPHLGVTEYALAGESAYSTVGSCKNTAINVSYNGHSPELLTVSEILESHSSRACLSTVFVGISGLEGPYTNRECSKHRLAGLGISVSLGDSDSCDIIIRVNSISCLESLGNNHVIKLPCAVVIKIDNNGYRLNILDSGCNYVHIVDRTKKDSIKC